MPTPSTAPYIAYFTAALVHILEQYTADNCTLTSFEYFDIECICSDASNQITSPEFQNFCWT